MAGWRGTRNRAEPTGDIAPYSQHVVDFFTVPSSVLVKPQALNYRRALGMTGLSRH